MLSYRVRVAGLTLLTLACLLSGSNLARAQVIQSPFQSDEAKEEEVPFRGSTFLFLQSLSSETFFRDTYLSYNPTYSWGFSLNLWWHFNDILQVGLNQEMEVELTDSDTTTLERQLMLSDTTVTLDALLLDHKVSDELEWNVHGAGALIAPTSLASQAATMIVGTRLGVSGGLTFAKVMNGLSFMFGGSYLHRFMTDNVPQSDVAYPCNAGAASFSMCTQLGGPTNVRNAIRLVGLADLALNEDWGVRLIVSHSWKRGADLADTSFTSEDGEVTTLPDASATHWRNTTSLDVSVGYLVAPWLGLSLAVSNTFQDRDISSNLRAPLRPVDTFIGLNTSLRLDEVYLAATGKSRKDTAKRASGSAL